MQFGPRIAVIPAGERWKGDSSLRPAFEDLVGAGAIIQHLPGALSPEAEAAVAAYQAARADLLNVMKRCSSGKELIARGYEADIALSAEVDTDDVAPILRNGAHVNRHAATPSP